MAQKFKITLFVDVPGSVQMTQDDAQVGIVQPIVNLFNEEMTKYGVPDRMSGGPIEITEHKQGE